MKQRANQVFCIAKDNAPTPGCTISKCISGSGEPAIIYFSLGAKTDISAEVYERQKLIICHAGDLIISVQDNGVPSAAKQSSNAGVRHTNNGEHHTRSVEHTLHAGDCYVLPAGKAVGMKSETSCVYTEIELEKGNIMNELLEAGKSLNLADLLDYKEDSIVNTDIVKNDHLKFMIMAFDEGTGLTEHAAPGEAIIFALEGKGIIGYEGTEHNICAGQSFKFDKGGKHYVKSDGRFKMALLIVYDK